MQQQQHASIIEYSNAVHVQPPTKTICVGTYRSFTTLNFSQLVLKDIKKSIIEIILPHILIQNISQPKDKNQEFFILHIFF